MTLPAENPDVATETFQLSLEIVRPSEDKSPQYRVGFAQHSLLLSIQQHLKARIAATGLSREDFAKRMEVSPGRLSQMLSGTDMKVSTLGHALLTLDDMEQHTETSGSTIET